MDKTSLKVYKASAGSGKTYNLALNYLEHLFERPDSFKNILAVTFTNKATNEMKSRILEQLHLLASNQKSDYLEILQNNPPRLLPSVENTEVIKSKHERD